MVSMLRRNFWRPCQSLRFNLLLPTDIGKLRVNKCCSAHSIGDRAWGQIFLWSLQTCAMRVLYCISSLPGNFIGQVLPCTVGPGTWIRGPEARNL